MQQISDLPEGTDAVIEGAAEAREVGPATTSAVRGGSLSDRVRSGREQLAGQAGEKARGLVTQGLERSAEALANV